MCDKAIDQQTIYVYGDRLNGLILHTYNVCMKTNEMAVWCMECIMEMFMKKYAMHIV